MKIEGEDKMEGWMDGKIDGWMMDEYHING